MVFDKQRLVEEFNDETLVHDYIGYQPISNILIGDNLITEESGLEEVSGKNFKHVRITIELGVNIARMACILGVSHSDDFDEH